MNTDPCPHAVPPPIVSTTGVLHIDTLDFGEAPLVDGHYIEDADRSKSIGFDLDGRCTIFADVAGTSCKSTTQPSGDGPGGIDNAFVRDPLWILREVEDNPSLAFSGYSDLALEGDGRATLYLGRAQGLVVIIPITGVRMGTVPGDPMTTVAGVVPLSAFGRSLDRHIDLVGPSLCGGATVRSLVDTTRFYADSLVSGEPDPERPCDGISIGFRISATPSTSRPELKTVCPRGEDMRAGPFARD